MAIRTQIITPSRSSTKGNRCICFNKLFVAGLFLPLPFISRWMATDKQQTSTEFSPKSKKRILILMWCAGLFPFLLIYIMLLINRSGLPTTETLENPPELQASIVYADNGEELGRYWRINRNGMRRLHRRNDTKLLKKRNIFWVNNLRMFNAPTQIYLFLDCCPHDFQNRMISGIYGSIFNH